MDEVVVMLSILSCFVCTSHSYSHQASKLRDYNLKYVHLIEYMEKKFSAHIIY